MTAHLEIVVLTGVSGSGKSTALRVLEDQGFFCVDNLPVTLIPPFVELCRDSEEEIGRVALGIDLRGRAFLRDYPEVLATLRAQGHRVEIVFLDASDEVLVRRFSETRRPHPLAEGTALSDGIRREREKLVGLREQADVIIDTSLLTVPELRAEVRRQVARPDSGTGTAVSLLSFGYKYGTPSDADIVLDVRFLPNPFFKAELRLASGLDPAVADYVLERDPAKKFLDKVAEILDLMLPLYEEEGRPYLRIAIGCTGGRHRSVAVAEALGKRLSRPSCPVSVRHRDIDGRSSS